MRAFLASVGPSGHGFGVGSPRMRAPHLISFLSLPTQHRKKRTFYAGSRAIESDISRTAIHSDSDNSHTDLEAAFVQRGDANKRC